MHCCDFRAWNLVLVGQLSAGIFPFVLMFTEKRRELRQFVKTRTRRSTITVLLVKTKLQGEEKRVTLISLPPSPGRSLGPGLMEVKEEVSFVTSISTVTQPTPSHNLPVPVIFILFLSIFIIIRLSYVS